MSKLIRMGSCPHCGNGVQTACYAEYIDGFKCFSCGKSKSYNKERMAFMGRSVVKARPELDYPKHERNPDKFNIMLKQWLYKYYIFDDLIRENCIYATDNSLLFNVINNGEIVFYVQRFFPEKRIINHGAKVVDKFRMGSKSVVLVEDYASAVRVSKHMDCWCLFGTSINYGDIATLLDDYNNIYIWLDGDIAGQTGSKKIEDQLVKKAIYLQKKFPYKYARSWNFPIISTELDPKEYSNVEIERILYES